LLGLSRTNKYGNIRTEVDGIKFASKAEAHRYQELKLLQKAGEIKSFRMQPKYALYSQNNKLIGYYIADFEVIDKNDHIWAEDVKGVTTQLFNWKAKHFRRDYSLELRIIKA